MAKGDAIGGAMSGMGMGGGQNRPLADRLANPAQGHNFSQTIGPSEDILAKLFGHAQGKPFQGGSFVPPGLAGGVPRNNLLHDMGPNNIPGMQNRIQTGMMNPSGGFLQGEGLGSLMGSIGPFGHQISSPMQSGFAQSDNSPFAQMYRAGKLFT